MIIDFTKGLYLTRALNEGWVPNWDDQSQGKWIPIFYMGGSGGFRFYGSNFYIVDACAGSGSAFCFREKRLSDYAAKQFPDVCKGVMTFLNLKK